MNYIDFAFDADEKDKKWLYEILIPYVDSGLENLIESKSINKKENKPTESCKLFKWKMKKAALHIVELQFGMAFYSELTKNWTEKERVEEQRRFTLFVRRSLFKDLMYEMVKREAGNYDQETNIYYFNDKTISVKIKTNAKLDTK